MTLSPSVTALVQPAAGVTPQIGGVRGGGHLIT